MMTDMYCASDGSLKTAGEFELENSMMISGSSMDLITSAR